MGKRILILLLVALITGLGACSDPAPTPGADVLAPLPTADAALPSLIDLVAEDPNLAFFLSGLNNVGLTDDLQSGGPFTVFAPSNVAFSEAGLIVSQVDPALLGEVLDNHLVDGSFAVDALIQTGSVVTLVGEPLQITQEGQTVKVAYAPLVSEASPASNGVLYTIDTLLLPPEKGPEKSMWGVLQADGRFSRFVAIMAGTELMGNLRFGEIYDGVLAPTNEAFDLIPADVQSWLAENPEEWPFVASFHLLSPDGWPQGTDLTAAAMVELGAVRTHVAISGSGFGFGFEELAVSQTEDGITIGDARIIEADIDASNGVVQAIDTVLIPEALGEHVP